MKKIVLLLIVTCSSSVFAAQDPKAKQEEHAKKLHAKSCVSCHDSGVYTREDRRIRSLDALAHQVKRCEAPAQAKWTPQEADGVVNYLNKDYYKF